MFEELKRAANRIYMMVTKATIDSVKDSDPLQSVKVENLADEVQDNVERVQNFGFTSVPPKGGESIVVCVGGNKDNSIVIASDSAQYRKKDLKDGEVAVYDKTGNYIYLKEDGSVEIKSSNGVSIEGDVEIDGNLDVTGDISVTGDVSSSLTSLNDFYTEYLIHTHTAPAGGGTTTPPL